MSDDLSLKEQIVLVDQAHWPRLHDQSAAERVQDSLAAYDFPAPVSDLLQRAASCSPYLERLFARTLPEIPSLIEADPSRTLQKLTDQAADQTGTSDELKVRLRHLKNRFMFVLSVCDVAGILSDLPTMEALSGFADSAVIAAFTVALQEITKSESKDIVERSGFVVLAMGKHGASELNYSSDIDLVVFYDPAKFEILLQESGLQSGRIDPRRLATRVTQTAVSILHDQTGDGYVFRTDLRLRPDPGASSPAVTLDAAERYYESYGQNWERAAFSKARVIFGHPETAAQVEAFLTPFIWRKYLDFAAIEDIHSIKRQIHAVKGLTGFELPGHDIKLGRGGIREVEFYAQTQQLILGGKNPALRECTTLGGLQALASAGHIRWDVEHELRDAYLFLRRTEHRIQMVNDEQTHQLPKDPDHFLRLSRLAGYDTTEDFERDVTSALLLINDHYADLFEEEERLAADAGSLVFTGVDDHPDTIRTLTEMGFEDPSAVSAAIRQWHAGGMRATKSARARELLTRLVPVILKSLADTGNAQQAFTAFDALLRQMPAGVQFFSLILSNQQILNVLAKLITASPRLARDMARHAHMVEALLGETFLAPDQAGHEIDLDDLAGEMAAEVNFEDALDLLRRRLREARFQATCRLLIANSLPRDEGRKFAHIADAAIRSSLTAARDEVVRRHGDMEGGLAVIAMGRLGANALTATSDLDLIFVYDAPADAMSDHVKPLDSVTWFTRYVRRLVTALSAETGEGGLYEVDMALRPSGGAGPAAVRLSAFQKYYENDAWTWEAMALVKARIVVGDPLVTQAVNDEIERILTRPRDADKVKTDVLEMRQRLLRDKPPKSDWDFKLKRGGLTDIDFICQYLSLVHGAGMGRFPLHIADALPVLQAMGFLSAEDAHDLVVAWQDYEAIMQLQRAALGNEGSGEALPPVLLRQIATRLQVSETAGVIARLASHAERVQSVFTRVVGAY